MLHKIHFLISPKPALFSKIDDLALDEFEYLKKPVLWSGMEGDRGQLTRDDLDSFIKLLYADMLGRECSSLPGFDRVFSDFSASVYFFDRNWSMVRVSLDMTMEDAVEDSIRSGTYKRMIPSGSEMLDKIIAEYAIRFG
ncbi:hypothetical protein [Lysobacter hankyongensis]|uniref:Uncharacterized protein n=1 Tax=Lysobacter hankyongensis TaxID=1176535 RepID=A0ABP9BHA6_9GAMM